MDQTPALTVGAVSMFVSGDHLVITHKGKAGIMQISVPAQRLERWARAILRDEAFAPATTDAKAQEAA